MKPEQKNRTVKFIQTSLEAQNVQSPIAVISMTREGQLSEPVHNN